MAADVMVQMPKVRLKWPVTDRKSSRELSMHARLDKLRSRFCCPHTRHTGIDTLGQFCSGQALKGIESGGDRCYELPVREQAAFAVGDVCIDSERSWRAQSTRPS